MTEQNLLIAALAKRGMSKATEKQIFWEETKLKDRAMAEAESAAGEGTSPDGFLAEARRKNELEEKYQKQLLQRYRNIGLTDQARIAILTRGVAEKWPSPDPRGAKGAR
jgi:hypothetical protein